MQARRDTDKPPGGKGRLSNAPALSARRGFSMPRHATAYRFAIQYPIRAKWVQSSVKIDRHGQAKVLTQEEIQLLFSQGLTTLRDRALFAVMLYTACRVNEAVTLRAVDVYDTKGRVRPELIIRKANTKGKLATRTIPVVDDLRRVLVQYKPPARRGFLFPGKNGRPHLHPDSAAWLLREACKRVDIEGASTHSFRRTALTHLSNAGVPMRVIQQISGHRTLDELYKYLEVRPDQVRGAIASLSMLAPVDEPLIGKPTFPEDKEKQESPTLSPDPEERSL